MSSTRIALAVAAAAALATVAPALASGARKDPAAATCSVSGNVVGAAGLPTDEVINFLVTDASGTYGWVLGFTSDGTWSVNVPPANGPTTYQFVSRTWGPNGSKYRVFASCS